MSEPVIPDRFEVLEEIAHGDSEILLRARDRVLQREVILRRPTTALSSTWRNSKVADAELRSARALAKVQHPGVVKLIDVQPTPDGPLVVMEPIPGETLAQRLGREKKLEPADVARLGRELAGALAAVHAQGIVHRGVAASNVVIRPDGAPCLAGFVFAKFDARADSAIPGTTFIYARGKGDDPPPTSSALPPHPSPEQVQGRAADARSDLFALGWVLYEALTGEPPYPRDLDVERWSDPKDPRKLDTQVPKPLAHAILRCLKKSPLQRFASADELRAALEAADKAAAAPAGGAAAQARSRTPIFVGLGVVVVAAASVPLWLKGPAAAGDGRRGPEEWTGPVHFESPEGLSDVFDNSYALLIGIGRGYEGTGFDNLPNAERDVKSIARKLEEMKDTERWKVELILGPDATKQRIGDELHDLAKLTGPNDRVLIYYAGHGSPNELSEDFGYIVPAGARPPAQDKSHQDWLSFDESFQLFFAGAKAKHVLVAVDCCFGGRALRGIAAPTPQPANKHASKRARVILSSGGKNEQVLDAGVTDHSPFAQVFLDALSKDRDMLTSGMLWGDISTAFARFPAQSPKFSVHERTHGGGEFVLFSKPPK